jgi:membrane protease YdiL (CAAX protease family)
VRIGIIISLISSLLLIFFTATTKLEETLIESIEALTLIPLYILFTSSLPWFFLHQDLLFPAVYSIMIGLCIHQVRSKGFNLKEIGFNLDYLRKTPLYGLVGIPLGIIEYYILTPSPTYPHFNILNLFKDMIYMFLFVGLAEELLFRGLIQRSLTRLFNPWIGILMSSFVFSIMHLTWHSIPELIFVYIAGTIFGYIYMKTQSLIPPIIAHGLGNTILVSVIPYLIK